MDETQTFNLKGFDFMPGYNFPDFSCIQTPILNQNVMVLLKLAHGPVVECALRPWVWTQDHSQKSRMQHLPLNTQASRVEIGVKTPTTSVSGETKAVNFTHL